jgi:hypothetical protein
MGRQPKKALWFSRPVPIRARSPPEKGVILAAGTISLQAAFSEACEPKKGISGKGEGGRSYFERTYMMIFP